MKTLYQDHFSISALNLQAKTGKTFRVKEKEKARARFRKSEKARKRKTQKRKKRTGKTEKRAEKKGAGVKTTQKDENQIVMMHEAKKTGYK